MLTNSNKITLNNENGCLMDSDRNSLGTDNIGPNSDMSKTYFNKVFNTATFTGTGFNNTKGTFICIPTQTVADPSAEMHVLIHFYYEGNYTGSIGGFGQTEHTVVLNDMCGKDQYVETTAVSIQCGVDDQGYAVYASPIACTKSNAIRFRTVNTDEASAQSTRTFKVCISGYAMLSNTNFGLGQLFPKEG